MLFGPEYPKIQTVFKRDTKGHILPDEEYSLPEFTYLQDNVWRWTEKVDGTNIRIHFRPQWQVPGETFMAGDAMVTIGGRTNNAQIPAHLANALEQYRDVEKFIYVFSDEQGTGAAQTATPVTLYGEGYGAKIQKGGGNYRSDQGFILFDVKVGRWWLTPASVRAIAIKMDMDVVPLMGHWSLNMAIAEMRRTAKQKKAGIDPERRLMHSHWSEVDFEGIVGTPTVGLFNRRGERIITKLKIKDFEQYLKETKDGT